MIMGHGMIACNTPALQEWWDGRDTTRSTVNDEVSRKDQIGSLILNQRRFSVFFKVGGFCRKSKALVVIRGFPQADHAGQIQPSAPSAYHLHAVDGDALSAIAACGSDATEIALCVRAVSTAPRPCHLPQLDHQLHIGHR
jgi:hypothetical protein